MRAAAKRSKNANMGTQDWRPGAGGSTGKMLVMEACAPSTHIKELTACVCAYMHMG